MNPTATSGHWRDYLVGKLGRSRSVIDPAAPGTDPIANRVRSVFAEPQRSTRPRILRRGCAINATAPLNAGYFLCTVCVARGRTAACLTARAGSLVS